MAEPTSANVKVQSTFARSFDDQRRVSRPPYLPARPIAGSASVTMGAVPTMAAIRRLGVPAFSDIIAGVTITTVI